MVFDNLDLGFVVVNSNGMLFIFNNLLSKILFYFDDNVVVCVGICVWLISVMGNKLVEGLFIVCGYL